MGFLFGRLLRLIFSSDNDDGGISYSRMIIPVISFLIDISGFLLAFFIPIILLICLPLLLFGSSQNDRFAAYEKAKIMAIYESVPEDERTTLDKWIDTVFAQNESADEFEINDSYNVDYNLLICIDAVKYNQDFKNIKYNDVLNTCRLLYQKEVVNSTFEVEEEIEVPVLDSQGKPIMKDGKPVTTKKKVTVTKSKVTVNINMRDLDLVFQDMKIADEQIEQILYMYNNVYNYNSDFKELTYEEIQNRIANAPVLNISRQDLINVAFTLNGKVSYFWGGRSPAGWNMEWGIEKLVTAPGSKTTNTKRPFGLDCSGFVDWVYNTSAAVSFLNGDTSVQWNQSYKIKESELMPGDLAFQSSPTNPGINHVGIFVKKENGVNYFIHCASYSDGVTYDSWDGFKHYRRVFVKFKGD